MQAALYYNNAFSCNVLFIKHALMNFRSWALFGITHPLYFKVSTASTPSSVNRRSQALPAWNCLKAKLPLKLRQRCAFSHNVSSGHFLKTMSTPSISRTSCQRWAFFENYINAERFPLPGRSIVPVGRIWPRCAAMSESGGCATWPH